MGEQIGPGKGLRWLRRIWTYLTILVAIPVLIPTALIAVVYAAMVNLRGRLSWWYGMRLTVMQIVVTVFGILMRGSSWVFNRLRGHTLYIRSPYERVRSELLIVGHRGAPTLECENTLASYACAIRLGANAIELDLCYTKDGEVVIWHDWDPNDAVALFREAGSEPLQRCRPCFGKGEFRRCVSALTLAELRTHYSYVERETGADLPDGEGQIITWREFLIAANAWPSLTTVFLDMKVPPAECQYAAPMLLKVKEDIECIQPEFECVVMTIYPKILQTFKAVAPDMRYCFDKEFPPVVQDLSPEFIAERSTVQDALRYGHDYASIGRPTFLALSPFELYKCVVAYDLTLRHDATRSPLLIAWTINEPDELRWLLNSGIDGILTDQPGTLARMELKRRAIRMWLDHHHRK